MFTFREMGCLFREAGGVPPFLVDECVEQAAAPNQPHTPDGIKTIWLIRFSGFEVTVRVRAELGAVCKIWLVWIRGCVGGG